MEISRREMNKQYNKHRFEVLSNGEHLVIADHHNNTVTWYKKDSRTNLEGRTSIDYVDKSLETNGFRHIRMLEDNLNQEYDILFPLVYYHRFMFECHFMNVCQHL